MIRERTLSFLGQGAGDEAEKISSPRLLTGAAGEDFVSGLPVCHAKVPLQKATQLQPGGLSG